TRTRSRLACAGRDRLAAEAQGASSPPRAFGIRPICAPEKTRASADRPRRRSVRRASVETRGAAAPRVQDRWPQRAGFSLRRAPRTWRTCLARASAASPADEPPQQDLIHAAAESL